jgi:hypothetical protein
MRQPERGPQQILTTLALLAAAVFILAGPAAHGRSRPRPRPAQAPTRPRLPSSVKRDSSDNFAAAFGWQSALDTDLSFTEFFGGNHTVALRFMIQYPRSYQAPLLSAKGEGDYLIALAGYGEGRIKAERLLVKVGAQTIYYTAAGRLDPERWHWLALVRDRLKLRLYLDGSELKPDDSRAELSAETRPPAGTLRVGRKATGDAQFYGLMDDVAVFNTALGLKTLKTYYQESPRLRGDEADLTAAYLFEGAADAQARRREVRRGITLLKTATTTKVSPARDSKLDALALPPPLNRTKVLLPFQPGQAWKVIQGYGQSLSHHGGGCFAWDFARADGPTPEQPVYAAAAGGVRAISDNNDPEPRDDISKDNFNYLQVEIAEGEFLTYLHMKNGSLVDALKGFAPGTFPEFFPPFPLAAGVRVGKVGNTWLKEQPENWHLHFACVPYLNSPVSVPLAFSDYEVFDPQSKSWRFVARGVPRQDQIVRRTGPL